MILVWRAVLYKGIDGEDSTKVKHCWWDSGDAVKHFRFGKNFIKETALRELFQ